MLRKLLALVVPAAVLPVLVSGTAYALTTFRHDDATMETYLEHDTSDGTDTAWTSFSLPLGYARGSTVATLWVYGQAVDCAVPGGDAYLYPPSQWYSRIQFKPCEVFPTDGFGWHGFDIPAGSLSTGTNSFSIADSGANSGSDARYAIDTSSDSYSHVWQRDGDGEREISGELMWYLDLDGSVPHVKANPSPYVYDFCCYEWLKTKDFGTIFPGQSSTAWTITLTSDGLADLNPTLTLTGDGAGDYTVGNDTCTGATLPTGATCSFTLSFTPLSVGTKAATLEVSGPGANVLPFLLIGEGRTDVPPASTITTPNGALLPPGDAIEGTVISVASLVAEYVRFVPDLPGAATVTASADLTCNANRTSCTWSSAPLLVPGTYTVTAYGYDRQQHTEVPTQSIRVTVV